MVGYKIYFDRQSLDGLAMRSDVKMGGIVVGAVTAFRISERRPGSVEVVIEVSESTPVRGSTEAVVQRQLVTGVASIVLINADETSPRLTEAPPGEPYPVIAEGSSQLEQFSQSVTQLAATADDTLKRINALLSEENRKALGDTLGNLNRLSAQAGEDLRRFTARAERSLQGLDTTLASIGRAADQTTQDVQALGTTLSNSAATLTARYDDLGLETTQAVRDIRVSVNRMAVDVARLTERTDGLLAEGGNQLGDTAQALQSAAESLGAAARGFRDPRGILFGPASGELGPGETAP
jgi:phospholipid/cholesterol/gamma-HCH transport system substrate-binding protein